VGPILDLVMIGGAPVMIGGYLTYILPEEKELIRHPQPPIEPHHPH
jgi:hypothetical protein